MKQISKLFAFMALGLTLALSSNFSAQGQNVPVKRENPSFYYLEVKEASGGLSGKKVVSINYGKEAPTATSYKISDEKGTGLVKFENAIGAVNYLSAQGWEIVTVYKKDLGNSGQLIYLLRFDASKHSATAITRAIDDVLRNLSLQEVE